MSETKEAGQAPGSVPPGTNFTCTICGKKFSAPNAIRRKFCSDQCRKIGHRQVARNYFVKAAQAKLEVEPEHTCIICGKSFKRQARASKAYCSPACRIIGINLKNKQYRERIKNAGKK